MGVRVKRVDERLQGTRDCCRPSPSAAWNWFSRVAIEWAGSCTPRWCPQHFKPPRHAARDAGKRSAGALSASVRERSRFCAALFEASSDGRRRLARRRWCSSRRERTANRIWALLLIRMIITRPWLLSARSALHRLQPFCSGGVASSLHPPSRPTRR